MLEKGVNLHPTSSAGRLFDAVASLLGLRDRVSFEGQAAMMLEFAAAPLEDPGTYNFDVDNAGERMVINTLPVIRDVLLDLGRRVPVEVIGARFHRTLAEIILRVLERLRESEGLDRVVLSGGVFQNMGLLRRTVALLERAGFSVFWHRRVPTNDGGISLGQAVVARERCPG